MTIKEICKEAKETKDITNLEISDRANIPVSTVSNYFSGNSKAPSVYTVGPICAALGVSLDQYFGIESGSDSAEREEIAELQHRNETLEAELSAAKEKAAADRERISSEKKKDSEYNRKDIKHLEERLHSKNKVLAVLLIIFAVLLALFVAYLVCFDLPNPEYGIIRSEAFLELNRRGALHEIL